MFPVTASLLHPSLFLVGCHSYLREEAEGTRRGDSWNTISRNTADQTVMSVQAQQQTKHKSLLFAEHLELIIPETGPTTIHFICYYENILLAFFYCRWDL